jgi:hypothetical protein
MECPILLATKVPKSLDTSRTLLKQSSASLAPEFTDFQEN